MHPSECFRLLGLTRSANFEEIKLAYRRLARKYHPDVNQGDRGAAEKFRLVQEAYEILKDLPKDANGVVIPPRFTQPPSVKAPQPVKVKIEVKPPKPSNNPPPDKHQTKPTPEIDPETKLKLDMIRKIQDLLRQKRYLVAIPIVEGMRSRFPLVPEVIHWQAVVYQRQGCELLLAGRLREAEIYLNKALNTDPKNRELCFEVKRDLERLQQLSEK
jgi:tetratricopeptide (TPR) repeat protein